VLKERGSQLIAEVESSTFFQGGLTRQDEEETLPASTTEGKAKECRVHATKERGLFLLQANHCQHHRFHQQRQPQQERGACSIFTVKMLSAEDGRKDIIDTVQRLARCDRNHLANLTVSSFQNSLAGAGGGRCGGDDDDSC